MRHSWKQIALAGAAALGLCLPVLATEPPTAKAGEGQEASVSSAPLGRPGRPVVVSGAVSPERSVQPNRPVPHEILLEAQQMRRDPDTSKSEPARPR